MAFQVFDNRKPAECRFLNLKNHDCNKCKWSNSVFNELHLAFDYAAEWLGHFASPDTMQKLVQFGKVDYSGYGDIIEIRVFD